MKQPLPSDLLAWFRAYVVEHRYFRARELTALSENTIAGVLRTGTASRGTINRIEALRAGTLQPRETMQDRADVARANAARIINVAAEAFSPEVRRAILNALPADAQEELAVRYGKLAPLPRRNGKAAKL